MLRGMLRRFQLLPGLAAALAVLWGAAAAAGDPHPWPQPLFVEPTLTADGLHLLEGTSTGPKWTWNAKIDVRWAYGVGTAERAHQTRGDLAFGAGFPGGLGLALALPVGFTAGAHTSRGEAFALDGMGAGGAGIGDLRAGLLWSALPIDRGGFGLLFGAVAVAPTGAHERLLGEGAIGGEAFASFAIGLLGTRLGANLGYRLRPEHAAPGGRFEQDDDVLWRIGLRVPRENDVAWSFEAAGAIGVATAEGPWPEAGSRPVWLGLGVDFPLGRANRFGLSAGLGVGEAAPAFAIAARLTFEPVLPDEDGDGLRGGADACPLFPEDRDGFADGDGCPDGDNDGDSFPDDEDACPDRAGGESSADGC